MGFVTIEGKGDIYDPWGVPIRYTVFENIDKRDGCTAGLYGSVKGKVFTLKSFGPNRTNDDSNIIKDDIVIERYGQELIGALTAAGIHVDGTKGPSEIN